MATPNTQSAYKSTSTNLERALPFLAIAFGALLLLLFPADKPVWTDEILNIGWGEHTLAEIMSGRVIAYDHPPGHTLVLHLCYLLFGSSLAAYRVVSALPALGALWFVYLLGRRISPKVGR